MSKKLIRYSLMPLRLKNEKELIDICNDVEYQYKNNICDLAIFTAFLHPDRTPLKDKAKIYSEKYLSVKSELDKRGLKSGILIQSTIGHGANKFKQPFQEYIKFTNGEGDGICCPLDKDFLNYIYKGVQVYAKCKPSAILIDDDFRLIYRSGKGCACPLHMKKFNEEAGTNLTREELFSIVSSDHEKCEEYTQKFVKVQYDSLIELAKVIRSAIDSVDPSIQGVSCSGGDLAVVDAAKILAGKNNPSILRIANANYSYNSTNEFTYNMIRTAVQVEQFKGIDFLLAETDTCPRTRYSKTAKQLHAHYVGSILEGVKGAKHWLTKIENVEWKSAIAYRKILSKNAGLYETLATLVEDIAWHGFKVPLPKIKKVSFKKQFLFDENAFCQQALERYGLPVYYSTKKGGITCFCDGNDDYFRDDELKYELSANAIISGETAVNICNRGFEKYLGVKVVDFNNVTLPNCDYIVKPNSYERLSNNYKTLIKISDDVIETSKLVFDDDESGVTYISPGTTEYKNDLGGKVMVFSGTPKCNQDIYSGYSFLNDARKEQFVQILKNSGEPVIYYAGDENMYVKTGTLKDGRNLTSLINLCYDEVENLELVYQAMPNKVSCIDYDGSIKEIPFTYENGTIKTSVTLYCLDTLILIIE